MDQASDLSQGKCASKVCDTRTDSQTIYLVFYLVVLGKLSVRTFSSRWGTLSLAAGGGSNMVAAEY